MSSKMMRHPTGPLLAALTAALLLASPAPLAAQGDAGAQAQRHSDLATKLFLERDYAAAIVEFYKAYEVQPAPLLLYNIAICHQSMGDAARAREALDRALAHADITPKEAAAARARLSALDVLARATAPRDAERAPDKPRAAPTVVAQAPAQTPDWYTGLKWGALGVGAAGLAGALLINYTISDDVSAYESAQERRRATPEQADAIRADQRLGKGLLGAGLGLVAVGVGLWIFEPRVADGARGARLDVMITPEAGAVWLTVPLP